MYVKKFPPPDAGSTKKDIWNLFLLYLEYSINKILDHVFICKKLSNKQYIFTLYLILLLTYVPQSSFLQISF